MPCHTLGGVRGRVDCPVRREEGPGLGVAVLPLQLFALAAVAAKGREGQDASSATVDSSAVSVWLDMSSKYGDTPRLTESPDV